MWGDSVLGYHLINLGLHAAAACLFALILGRIRTDAVGPGRLSRTHVAGPRLANDDRDTESCVGPAPFRQAQGPERVEGLVAGPRFLEKTARRPAAALQRTASGRLPGTEWLAAAVFALHPVCVESVAWISEQKNTLSLVFYLLAALAYLRFDRGRSWSWYALALGLFILALLSKSVTATLPAALLLVQFWRRGRLCWRRDIVPLLPWLIIGAGAGLFTAWVEQNYIGARGQAYDLNLIQRCFLAGRVVWFYLGKLAWPVDLAFIYPRWQVGSGWRWSLGCLGLAATAGVLWKSGRWSRAPLIALLFFVGSLFPALGFFNVYPFVFSYVADHWQYLPCLGMIALATESAAGIARRLVRRFSGARRVVVGCVFAVAAAGGLAVLFFLTWRQCGLYRDVESRIPTPWQRTRAAGWLITTWAHTCRTRARCLQQSRIWRKPSGSSPIVQMRTTIWGMPFRKSAADRRKRSPSWRRRCDLNPTWRRPTAILDGP